MFVTRKTYKKRLEELISEKCFSVEVTRKYNELIATINDKGGIKFLDEAVILNDDMLLDLIKLCHPDLNKGSDTATKVTTFLNNIREGRR